MHCAKKQNNFQACVNLHIRPFNKLAKQTNHSMLILV